MSGLRDRVRRADRRLGALYWGAVTVFCGLFAVLCAWMAVNAFLHAEGAARWAGTGLGALCALVFGAGARGASRRRTLSEAFDD